MLYGWPREDVLIALKREFDFPERPGYYWQAGTPFMFNSAGRHPFVITDDPQVHDIARMAGEDVAFLPSICGAPRQIHDPTGDWWLCRAPE